MERRDVEHVFFPSIISVNVTQLSNYKCKLWKGTLSSRPKCEEDFESVVPKFFEMMIGSFILKVTLKRTLPHTRCFSCIIVVFTSI